MDTAIVDGRSGLQRAWDNTLTFAPKLIAFLLILIIGYIVAKVISGVVDKLLRRVGFDRLVERGGLKKAMGDSGFHPSDILGQIVFYALLLFVLELAFGVFGPNPISDLLNRVIAFLPNIFVAVCIVVIAAAIAAGVKQIIQGALGGLSYGRMLGMIAAGAIWVLGVFAALNQLQIAPQIVNGLFYAALAIIVGVTVVGVGGGLVMPMRNRWETALGRIEMEAPRLKEQVQAQAQAAQAAQATRPPQQGYMG